MNEILNKKVSRNFEVVKTYELGIKLLGEEVKALKYQGGTFTNSYIKILQGGLFLVNLNIPRYKKSSSTNYIPSRERKLLANKRELVEIKSKLIEDFIRMEHFRRDDNFEDFCLAMFQQLEGTINFLVNFDS